MSVSKWAWTENCEGNLCVGDCDLCDMKEKENVMDKQKAFEWMDKLIEWKAAEPDDLIDTASLSIRHCGNGDKETRTLLVIGVRHLANIIGYPYVREYHIPSDTTETYIYYKGWRFHDFP